MAIVPDDKDWTWVLERACPECGFDPADWPFRRIATAAEEYADRWFDFLGRTAPAELRRRPDEETWSPLEYGAHLRDVYRIMLARVYLIQVLDDPEFANWDQDGTAAAHDYAREDPTWVANELTHLGSSMYHALYWALDEHLPRTGRRSNGSRFTLETLARYFLHDVIHHTHDVGVGPVQESASRQTVTSELTPDVS